MCLTIKRKSHKQTAKKDIVVYKIVEQVVYSKRLRTPYQFTTVKIGGKYESKLTVYDDGIELCITKGLHSLKTKKEAIEAAKDITGCDYDQHIVRCIIPKGSEYYVGDFYDWKGYASSNIEYQEIIKTIKHEEL